MPLTPDTTYVHWADDGRATTTPGGEAFWARVFAPRRLLFVTRGEGTERRPVA